MNIGIIGSGEMGTCLASRFINLGHKVSMANSRGPESIQQLAREIGAEETTVAEATRNKEVIIISIPQYKIPELPKNLFKNLSEEVVVIDTGNYYPTLRDGNIPALEKLGIDSLWVQEHLDIPVIKVFNAILATSLKNVNRGKSNGNRIALAVLGDVIKSKELVFKLVEELGFDPFDLGSIAQSWKQQPGSSIYCRDINLHELQKRVDLMGTEWSQMRDLILAKRKADEILMRADYPTYLKSLQEQEIA